MAEDPDERPDAPNLELPSLFGRRRKKKGRAEEPEASAAPEAAPDDEATPSEPAAGAPADAPAARSGPAPVEGSARRLPPTPPPSELVEETAPIQVPSVEQTAPVPEPEPEPEPVPEPVAVEAPPPPPAPEPEPEPQPAPAPPPADVEETAVLPEPVPSATPASDREPEPAPVPAPDPIAATQPAPPPEPVGAPLFVDEQPAAAQTGPLAEEPDHGGPDYGEPVAEEPGRRRARKERTPLRLPRINPRVAVVVAGLVVGLVGVLLSFGAQQGCQSVRGVGSCGGSGLFALLVVVIVMILLGAAILRAWGLADPGSTSFLGVGLVSVIALLFFLSQLESVWMLVVIPVLTAVTFLVSWWVTETFVEQGADDSLHR